MRLHAGLSVPPSSAMLKHKSTHGYVQGRVLQATRVLQAHEATRCSRPDSLRLHLNPTPWTLNPKADPMVPAVRVGGIPAAEPPGAAGPSCTKLYTLSLGKGCKQPECGGVGACLPQSYQAQQAHGITNPEPYFLIPRLSV